MPEEGWIKAYRKLRDHPSWPHDGLVKLWLHCLFEANYASSTYLIPGTTDIVTVERGSFITGREVLHAGMYPKKSADTPVARTVYRWLQSLERMECVTLRTLSNRCTLVTVVNYETYQAKEAGQGSSDVPPVSKSCPAGVPPVSTSEEKKETKKGRKEETHRRVFVKPTVEEVAAYCAERRNGIDAEEFIDSNESTGWVIGKSCKPMRCWKSTIRTWEKVRSKNGVIHKQIVPKLLSTEELNRRGINFQTGEVGED